MNWIRGTVTKQAHVGIPEGTVEEEFGRRGFFGRTSHLYRTEPPVNWTAIEGDLRPEAIGALEMPGLGGDWIAGRVAFLENEDVRLCIARLSVTMPYAFRNADADEILFVHRGAGRIDTDFGILAYETGDYLVIPRGAAYRLTPSNETTALVIESTAEVELPERGPLGRHAVFDPDVIEVPAPAPALGARPDHGEGAAPAAYLDDHLPVRSASNDSRLERGPFGVAHSTCATSAPFRASATTCRLRRTRRSSCRTSWSARSSRARSRPAIPQALRVPFYHSNIDYDEVLFYHAGDFFSRAGIRPGMVTFHPQGIHHGPHPQAVAASKQKTRTDEQAVMIDTRRPLALTRCGARRPNPRLLEILDAEGDRLMENPLEMRGLAFIEFASPRPDELDKLFKALGFSRTHRHRARALDAYRQGQSWFLIDHERASFAQRFMAEHGPSVSALGFAFEDPRAAFEAAVRRGATPFDGRGSTSFDAPAIYGIGDSLVYFIDAESSFERELERLALPRLVPDKGFLRIDHLTNNVPQGELGKWSDFYKNVFGFVEVRSFDIEGTKSGLYSYALRAPCGTFSIPINEDKGERGQIAEYLREYRGPGVQHIAFLTKDILASVEAVGGAVEMLDIDADYYEEAFRPRAERARGPGAHRKEPRPVGRRCRRVSSADLHQKRDRADLLRDHPAREPPLLRGGEFFGAFSIDRARSGAARRALSYFLRLVIPMFNAAQRMRRLRLAVARGQGERK